MGFLEFKPVKCRDCFKCLRDCPVKAIRFKTGRAEIADERCILCGRCTVVCPQNAKSVQDDGGAALKMLDGKTPVVASVAPAFIGSFPVGGFAAMKIALLKLGFADAEETAVGAAAVSAEYMRILQTGRFKNFITSACPAVNYMIRLYYPKALPYLAPVVSPMAAHARMLKESRPDARIVFIGPCIAKKREAAESGVIDAALTFENLKEMFAERGAEPQSVAPEAAELGAGVSNPARYYPVNRGIIKSFDSFPPNYEYVAVDGVSRCFEVLEDIESLSGMFIEMNCCEHACINGPCALPSAGGALKANQNVRAYARKGIAPLAARAPADLSAAHARLFLNAPVPSERDIRAVLAQTGKPNPEDDLNCGACGYPTCRDKAVAVLNGFADIEMCLPFMRVRAESMSYEIIQNSPNGIVLLDGDYKILEINGSARKLLGVSAADTKGGAAGDFFNPVEFVIAADGGKDVHKKQIYIGETGRYAEMSIILLRELKVMFGVFKDITDRVEYEKNLSEIRNKTLETTDGVIKKQMRVAQEIASLLGETTAETKVALVKLKTALLVGAGGE
ncbi:MAG: PAS domain S-box protein [Clostridiales bacterium]|jgi:PAS domain S-box-containing protein|nr:PAS domain S-box protein [Clostridiales bacterium]